MKQYPIHVVSKLLGISPQGLKFFEKYGLTPFKRSKNGYRSYSILDIQIRLCSAVQPAATLQNKEQA